jgi:Ser/Thr protein kinase RdoA (MazF antagonist)
VTDPSFVLRAIRCFHDGDLGRDDVRRLSGSTGDGRVAYRLRLPDGRSRVVRAVRADGVVPDDHSGGAGSTMREWLDGRIATLVRLDGYGYFAPRAIRSRTGSFVADVDGWLISATSYVDGELIVPTPDQLRLLGDALGRLHALPDALGDGGRAADQSTWRAATIPYTLRALDAVESALPECWTDLYAALRGAVETIQERIPRLPEAITHGDAWPGNGVQTAPDRVALIDWDTGGRGFAVLDLGRCLLECHLDTDLPTGDPAAWHIRPDESRIAAVAQGYRRHRAVTATERESLLAAIRFGIAFVGAVHFTDAVRYGRQGPAMEARLARLRNRLEVSEQISVLARRHLES